MEESNRSSILQVKPDGNYPHPPSPLSHTLLNVYQKCLHNWVYRWRLTLLGCFKLENTEKESSNVKVVTAEEEKEIQ